MNSPRAHTNRDYARVLDLLSLAGHGQDTSWAGTLQRVSDALWDALHAQGVSWVGFYVPDPANPAQMLLAARRDKPACSPIGLHGVCGRGFAGKRPVVVRDVAVMGPNYIACDPRDRSEVVVPLMNPDGSCAGVLDVDSYDVGAFSVHDALHLLRILRAAGVSSHTREDESWVEVL